MPPPKYMNENRYSHLVATWHRPYNTDYEAESPITSFERRVHRMFHEGQRHLHHEEFRLALDTFFELQSLILKTADPKLPVDPYRFPRFKFPRDQSILNGLAVRAGEILRKTPVTEHIFPREVISDKSILTPEVQKKLKPLVQSEMYFSSFHGDVFKAIADGMSEAEEENWHGAFNHFKGALDKTPESEKTIRASIMHDMAVLYEKLNKRAPAVKVAVDSEKLFASAKVSSAQVHALETLTGMYTRGGKKQQAQQTSTKAAKIRKLHNLHPVKLNLPTRLKPVVKISSIVQPRITTPTTRIGSVDTLDTMGSEKRALATVMSTPEVPALMGMAYVPKNVEKKTITIRGEKAATSIVVNARAAANLVRFEKSLATVNDLEILTGFWKTPIQMVAYLPHMYFFLIPMAIADCFAGLGNYDDAEEEYIGVLTYPFINSKYELVRWWTRLAELYLEMGDEAYRRGKDSASGWAKAKVHYEKIVRTGGTINAASVLYKNSKLAAIRNRVKNFLAAPNPVAFRDNPRILMKVLRAKAKLNQIKAGLNYFGFAPDYIPPFSFEYLQNTARYFAQNASQIEQQYIQYKSTAENEEFRREQLDQQAEIARQTVILEQRGLAEAEAGIAVAQASLNYAEVQRQNAVKSKQDFENVRWELLEYAEAEAWANASNVDRDDQVKLTWNGYYYSSNKKRRNVMLKELAYKRTRISHDLESKKLQRAIDSAVAYKGIAQAQVAQAQARRAVAQQRVQIAQLQQRYAEENRDFLDMKEFSARLWYELAREARRLTHRYLEMAIEVAMLMERAYNAETERGLNIIRFDYGRAATQDLMAGDRLRSDIDYFTLDHVTTIKPKKSPVKKMISLADSFPMAFHRLKSTGQCFFQTELQDFDRQHPGLYLCKLRNVELIFVGITESSNLAGSLRNIGVSKFRLANGSIVSRHYPSDVLALSHYDLRQDALAYRLSPNDLRLFENNGIDTLWQLILPLDGNEFDFNNILDIQLVLYYDGLHSSTLETSIKSALPATGSASRSFSMRLMYPDELFYLKNKGDAELIFDTGMFPHNQIQLKRSDITIKVIGDASVINGLTMRLNSADHSTELVLKADAQGEVNDNTSGKPLRKLRNRDMLDKWTLRITKADNPGLVTNDTLDLKGLQDIVVFFEYTFKYR